MLVLTNFVELVINLDCSENFSEIKLTLWGSDGHVQRKMRHTLNRKKSKAYKLKQEAHHKVGLGEMPCCLIRNSAYILHTRNWKMSLMMQYTYLKPYLTPFPSYNPFSAFRTHFVHFTVVFNRILQLTRRNWWRHFWQVCAAACPR